MEPAVLLAGLQRTDDEGMLFQLELLEQLCAVLAIAESRDMLAIFDPTSFIPALAAIMGREVNVFPEVPVLACRAVKHFLSLDPRLSRVAVRASFGTLCLSALALTSSGEETTEESLNLAENAIKVLEMLCRREGRQVARMVPGGAHVAVGQLVAFIEVCDALYPADVLESALMALRGVLSACPADETRAHEAASVLYRLIGDGDRPKLQYAALQGLASLTSVLSVSRNTEALERIAEDVSSELIGALSQPRSSPATLSLMLLVLWRLCAASPATLHGCLRRGLAPALATLLRETCAAASPSKGVEASAVELLRFASALSSLLGAVGNGATGRRAEEYLPQGSYASSSEADVDAAELLREAIKRDDLASVCALIDLGGQPVVDAVDGCEQSMLMWAVHASSANVIEMLALHASSLDYTTPAISTGSALHFAAYFGRADAVRVLLRHGANPSLRNRRGRTPAEEALLKAPQPPPPAAAPAPGAGAGAPADAQADAAGAPAAAPTSAAPAPPPPPPAAPAPVRGGHAQSGRFAEVLQVLAQHAGPAAAADELAAADAWRSGKAEAWRAAELPALLRALLPALVGVHQCCTPRLQPRVLQLVASLAEGADPASLQAALGAAPMPGAEGGEAEVRADADADLAAQQLYAFLADLLNARESARSTVAVLRTVAALVGKGGSAVVADLRGALVLDAAAQLLRRSLAAGGGGSRASSPQPSPLAHSLGTSSPPPLASGISIPPPMTLPLSLPRPTAAGEGAAGPSSAAAAPLFGSASRATPTRLVVGGLGASEPAPPRPVPSGSAVRARGAQLLPTSPGRSTDVSPSPSAHASPQFGAGLRAHEARAAQSPAPVTPAGASAGDGDVRLWAQRVADACAAAGVTLAPAASPARFDGAASPAGGVRDGSCAELDELCALLAPARPSCAAFAAAAERLGSALVREERPLSVYALQESALLPLLLRAVLSAPLAATAAGGGADAAHAPADALSMLRALRASLCSDEARLGSAVRMLQVHVSSVDCEAALPLRTSRLRAPGGAGGAANEGEGARGEGGAGDGGGAAGGSAAGGDECVKVLTQPIRLALRPAQTAGSDAASQGVDRVLSRLGMGLGGLGGMFGGDGVQLVAIEPLATVAQLATFVSEQVVVRRGAPSGGGAVGSRVHRGVTCDCCATSPIVGVRYKCAVCADFDLCADCYGAQLHSEEGHAFVRIRTHLGTPEPMPPRAPAAAAPAGAAAAEEGGGEKAAGPSAAGAEAKQAPRGVAGSSADGAQAGRARKDQLHQQARPLLGACARAAASDAERACGGRGAQGGGAADSESVVRGQELFAAPELVPDPEDSEDEERTDEDDAADEDEGMGGEDEHGAEGEGEDEGEDGDEDEDDDDDEMHGRMDDDDEHDDDLLFAGLDEDSQELARTLARLARTHAALEAGADAQPRAAAHQPSAGGRGAGGGGSTTTAGGARSVGAAGVRLFVERPSDGGSAAGGQSAAGPSSSSAAREGPSIAEIKQMLTEAREGRRGGIAAHDEAASGGGGGGGGGDRRLHELLPSETVFEAMHRHFGAPADDASDAAAGADGGSAGGAPSASRGGSGLTQSAGGAGAAGPVFQVCYALAGQPLALGEAGGEAGTAVGGAAGAEAAAQLADAAQRRAAAGGRESESESELIEAFALGGEVAQPSGAGAAEAVRERRAAAAESAAALPPSSLTLPPAVDPALGAAAARAPSPLGRLLQRASGRAGAAQEPITTALQPTAPAARRVLLAAAVADEQTALAATWRWLCRRAKQLEPAGEPLASLLALTLLLRRLAALPAPVPAGAGAPGAAAAAAAASPLAPGRKRGARALQWESERLGRRTLRQLSDPLSAVTCELPGWCAALAVGARELLPLGARLRYFLTFALGAPRLVQRLAEEESSSVGVGAAPGRHARLGALRRERVSVPRAQLLPASERLLRQHARSGAVLEVVFAGESGSGNGVTAEFYSQLALALQEREVNAQLTMWLADAAGDDGTGAHLNPAGGLFPAPIDPSLPAPAALLSRFAFVGRLMGKALLDKHTLPLPLSVHTVALAAHGRLGDDCAQTPPGAAAGGAPARSAAARALLSAYGSKGQVLLDLAAYARARAALLAEGEAERAERLRLPDGCAVEDYGLVFADAQSGIELVPGGRQLGVTAANASDYVQRMLDLLLHAGIARQMEACRAGLAEVIGSHAPLALAASELQGLLCGEREVVWDEPSLLQHVVPTHGYTRSSQTYGLLIAALLEMDQAERRAFVHFTTGCPHLPPTGLAALSPTLSVSLKHCPEGAHTELPSASTCFHVLKLPPYSSIEVLRERLGYAIANSKGLIDMS